MASDISSIRSGMQQLLAAVNEMTVSTSTSPCAASETPKKDLLDNHNSIASVTSATPFPQEKIIGPPYFKPLKDLTLSSLFFDYYDLGLKSESSLVKYQKQDKARFKKSIQMMQSHLNPHHKTFLTDTTLKPCKVSAPEDYKVWSDKLSDIANEVEAAALNHLEQLEAIQSRSTLAASNATYQPDKKRLRAKLKRSTTAIMGRLDQTKGVSKKRVKGKNNIEQYVISSKTV